MDAIIFDGDDTLWETALLYAGAKQDFFWSDVLVGLRSSGGRERISPD